MAGLPAGQWNAESHYAPRRMQDRPRATSQSLDGGRNEARRGSRRRVHGDVGAHGTELLASVAASAPAARQLDGAALFTRGFGRGDYVWFD